MLYKNFLDWLHDYLLLKKDSAQWNGLVGSGFWCRLLPGSPLCEPGSAQSQILHMFPHIWLKGSYILSIQQQQKQVTVYSSGQEAQILLSTHSLPRPHTGISLFGQQFYHRNWKRISDKQSTIINKIVSYSIICLTSLILHKTVSLWTQWCNVKTSLLKSWTLMKYLSQNLYKYSSMWSRTKSADVSIQSISSAGLFFKFCSGFNSQQSHIWCQEKCTVHDPEYKIHIKVMK